MTKEDVDLWGRSSIEFCLGEAASHYDHVGVAIASMLLEAPDSVLDDCKVLGIPSAFAAWKDMWG